MCFILNLYENSRCLLIQSKFCMKTCEFKVDWSLIEVRFDPLVCTAYYPDTLFQQSLLVFYRLPFTNILVLLVGRVSCFPIFMLADLGKRDFSCTPGQRVAVERLGFEQQSSAFETCHCYVSIYNGRFAISYGQGRHTCSFCNCF